MGSKRPSKVYRKPDRPAYTRNEFVQRKPEKILKRLSMGQTERKNFPITIKLIASEDIQISERALESVRTNINRVLGMKVNGYRLQIVPFPHHFVRQHGLIGVAKGERFAKGMRASFGKVTGRFARVKKNQPILIVGLEEEKNIQIVRRALTIARQKLPKLNQTYKIVVENEF